MQHSRSLAIPKGNPGAGEPAATAALDEASEPLLFPPSQRLGALASRCELAAHRTGKIGELADLLGLPVPALTVAGVGWHQRRRCWTSPMFDAPDHVCGIRTRFADGAKRAIPGSRNALFGLDVLQPAADLVVVVEGASDTVAGLALGLAVIGKPSATAGDDLLARHLRGRRVAVLADADQAGRAGARATADRLAAVCPDVRVIEPPPGAKDLRAWLAAGATRDDVLAVVGAAAPVRLGVVVRTWKVRRCP